MAKAAVPPADQIAGVERAGDPPFGMVHTAIIRDPTLPRNVKTIYTYLTTWCADHRSAFPGRELMAEETGLSVSAIDEAKRIGVACKLWSIEKVGTKGGYAYNKYWLHDRDGKYVPGSGPGARVKGKPRGKSAAQEPRPKSGRGHSQNLGPVRPESGPYQDKGSTQALIKTSEDLEDSLPARPHADARGRRGKPAAKTRRANRADYPATDDWIQPDDPEGMVDAIVDHVETLYGEPGGLRALLLSKAEPNLDPETWDVIPGTEAAPGHLMNLALKAGKWGTVDFAYINRQEQLGRGPDTPLAAVPDYTDPWAS